MPDKPTIVFAHGLWADGSCYSKVIPLLLADGFQVISTQNHLNTVADDAAAVGTSFARASGPVVLVGHSYGGTVITAAGTDNRVAALVYICAFAPEDGDTTLVDQNKYPATPIFQHIEVVEGRIWLRPSGVPEFAGDLSEAEQQLVWATQMAPLADLFGQPVPGAAWKLKPCQGYRSSIKPCADAFPTPASIRSYPRCGGQHQVIAHRLPVVLSRHSAFRSRASKSGKSHQRTPLHHCPRRRGKSGLVPQAKTSASVCQASCGYLIK
jgi:pimeloyl-ACP methyl ester carboxylesterase